jgi:hypothetical protein
MKNMLSTYLNSLSGWNRLFLLLSLIWCIFSAYVFYVNHPPKSYWLSEEEAAQIIRESLCNQAKNSTPLIADLPCPPIQVQVKYEEGERRKSEAITGIDGKDEGCESETFVMSDNTEIQTCHYSRDHVTLAYSTLKDTTYKQGMSNYRVDIAKEFLVVMFQLFALYAFAYTVSWVIRGFRKPK